MLRKKVFVSGRFDTLNFEYLVFLERAAVYGDLYVEIASDKTLSELTGRKPSCSEQERKYILETLKPVKACYINPNSCFMDFAERLRQISPDYFIVNENAPLPKVRH